MGSINWLIGCSGFHYKEWKDEFYPKGLAQKNWFDYYTQHFNTLELNVTFYRFPELKSLQNWYSKAPEGFVFSAKVPRTVTHYQKFIGTQQVVTDFYAVLREGLREKLGCVLFQLPPQFSYSEERLQAILEQLDYSFSNVIEFRHESWWRGDAMEVLHRKNVSFCGVSFPKIIHDEAIVTTPIAYYRFHGVPKLFYSEYDPTFLQEKVQELETNEDVETAYLYFNNTASLAALHNARYVQQLVKSPLIV
ncbi:MAG: hypothetical protein JWP88_1580 [Flaviaesturariibacter sp.]|nr:hypothetical protein [Flaviaesturariibacter sp.]